MRIEAEPIQLELKIRGQPKVDHGILEFARSRGKKRHKCAKLRQRNSYGNSYTRYYTQQY